MLTGLMVSANSKFVSVILMLTSMDHGQAISARNTVRMEIRMRVFLQLFVRSSRPPFPELYALIVKSHSKLRNSIQDRSRMFASTLAAEMFPLLGISMLPAIEKMRSEATLVACIDRTLCAILASRGKFLLLLAQ